VKKVSRPAQVLSEQTSHVSMFQRHFKGTQLYASTCMVCKATAFNISLFRLSASIKLGLVL